MEIEFSGYYQKDIYFKVIRWIYRLSPKSLILRVAAFVVFSALYGAVIVVALQEEGASSFELARIGRHLITFLILGYLLVQPYINSYRRATELWNDPVIRRNITGRVSTIGVSIDPMKDWMTWDTFVKTNKTPVAITLLTASGMFVLLQRSFFREERDWKMVQNIVDTKVQEVIE
ncbi:MAG TPA: hypothetical protein VK206_09690 [Anaerolineales bacterium]|nr:hypothetical protein [Anaerolineales bacterium]HLO34196.1 hypothetical protein [Anaerolineales bacterium]